MHTSLPTSLALGAAVLVTGAAAQTTFTQGAAVPTGLRADGPTLADLDGDGVLDLAVSTDGAANQDLVELFRGDGAGGFTPAGTIFLPINSSPKGIAAAQIDGAGGLDLAIILENFGQVVVATNNGGFAFTVGAGTPTGGVESRVIEAANMNGDASPDFVISSRDSNNVSVLINNGGTLSFLGTTAAGVEPRDIAVGDFNGDGLDDVAAGAHDSRSVVFLRNTGGGNLVQSQSLGVPISTRPSGMAAADMDGDGDIDVIAGAGDDNAIGFNFVAVYTNNGGTFSGPAAFPTGGLDAGDVLAADFDLDNDIDVLVTHETSGTLALLSNNGAGGLGAAMQIAFGGEPDTLAGGDIDGNGSMDFVVTRRQAAGVTPFLNDTAGNPGGIGTNYCVANANSSGQAARMSATGSATVANNDLTVVSSQMPLNTVGYFLTSTQQGFVANPVGSAGNLCLGGQIGRFDTSVMSSGATGEIALLVDLTAIPQPNGTVAAMAGQTWNFQSWFRDSAMGMPTSNFSDGLSVPLN